MSGKVLSIKISTFAFESTPIIPVCLILEILSESTKNNLFDRDSSVKNSKLNEGILFPNKVDSTDKEESERSKIILEFLMIFNFGFIGDNVPKEVDDIVTKNGFFFVASYWELHNLILFSS